MESALVTALYLPVKITALLWFGAALLSGFARHGGESCCTCAFPCATASIWTPTSSTRPAARAIPTILVRTPYGKGADLPPGYSSFIEHGYAVVLQDVRGRYGSEGVFDALKQEGPDGYDTLNWIAAQPWSDGKVGMIGGSYLGIAQWRVALLNNPHLKAIFPVVSGSDDYFDRFYSPGGAMKLGHRLLWLSQNLTPAGIAEAEVRRLHRSSAACGPPIAPPPRQTLPLYQTILEHPTYDSFWKELSVREKIDRVRVPVFRRGRLVRQLRGKRSGSVCGVAQAGQAGRPGIAS